MFVCCMCTFLFAYFAVWKFTCEHGLTWAVARMHAGLSKTSLKCLIITAFFRRKQAGESTISSRGLLTVFKAMNNMYKTITKRRLPVLPVQARANMTVML